MGISARELTDQLAERYRTDPEYRALVDSRNAAHQSRAEERARKLAPFRDALRGAGLTEYGEDRRVVEIAIEHLGRSSYDDETRAAIARNCGGPGAAELWDRLRALYLSASGPGEREALAGVLAVTARSPQVADLKALVATPELGESRVLLLRPINRLDRKGGRDFVLGFLDDRQLGIEADRIRRRVSRNS